MFRSLGRLASCCLTLAASVLFTSPGFAQATRPSAHMLLPDKTLVLVRVPDSKDFVEKFRGSGMGKMLEDEQIRPLVSHLYGSMANAFGQIQDQVGLPLDEILSIPQGELCFAVVAMPDAPPALLVLLEVGSKLPAAQKLLDRGGEEMERQGVAKKTEAVGDVLLNIWTPGGGDRPRNVIQGVKDGVIIIGSNMDAVKDLLARWNGTQKPDSTPLADNKKFTAIMSRCGATADQQPQFLWYVDPIELARISARGNFAAQTTLAILPAIGLDGLQGLGGGLIFDAGEFDAVQHFHVMLDNPRNGVLKALTMRSGDSTPEPWVPGDAATYMTVHWDFQSTFREVSMLIDSFQTEGTTANEVKRRVSEPLGVDFEKELLGAMDGRVTYVSWFEKPARLNSQTQMIAIKLKDAGEFRGTLDKIMGKFPEQFEKDGLGSVSYYKVKVPEDRRRRFEAQREGNRVQLTMRAPEPCLAILGDYFVATDSLGLLRHCIATQSDPEGSLAKELDFKLIASNIGRQVGGVAPGMVLFNRPEEGLKMLYDLAQAAETRTTLSNQAENNRFFKALDTALKDNPLPPFAVISRYLAPGGGMMVNDETGFHYTAFTLKRKL